MPLIQCPDCEKQISDRVDACPFCGCPAKYFILPEIPAKKSIPVNAVKDSSLIEDEIQQEKSFEFHFGVNIVRYPINMGKYAKMYGAYCSLAVELFSKYESEYTGAGSISNVLDLVSSHVVSDLEKAVENAVKDIYSYGVIITKEDFIHKYEINIVNHISGIINQVLSVQEERKELSERREFEKANRGRWQGGGFGLKGAIKGAATAGLLNAGSGLLHSIGDAIGKSGDNRYIDKKMEQIYLDKNNCLQFTNGVYKCVYDILFGIKDELIDNELIPKAIFDGEDKIRSLYKTTVKYEENQDKLYANMVKCFSYEPELYKYYKPIITRLFDESDIKDFLEFWNLSNMYDKLYSEYSRMLTARFSNPFIDNRCEIVIEIQGNIIKQYNGISLKAKVVKGTIEVGKALMVVSGFANPVVATTVMGIFNKEKECSTGIMGKTYTFLIKLSDILLLNDAKFLVDMKSFESPESNLYVTYWADEEEKCWGFADKYRKSNNAIHTFIETDRYCSSRGISFGCSKEEVQQILGKTQSYKFAGDNDVVYSMWRSNERLAVDVLPNAVDYFAYRFGEEYIIRIYFNEIGKIVLIAYLKNIDTSKETEDIIQDEIETTAQDNWKVECVNCGKIIGKEIKFCNFCGELSPTYSVVCPKCKKRIKTGVKFCNFCGSQINVN